MTPDSGSSLELSNTGAGTLAHTSPATALIQAHNLGVAARRHRE